MPKHYYELIKDQAKVKVIAQAQDDRLDKIKGMMLAAASAGVFYFFGYNVWHALLGG